MRYCSLRAIAPFLTVSSKDLYCIHVKKGLFGKGLMIELGECRARLDCTSIQADLALFSPQYAYMVANRKIGVGPLTFKNSFTFPKKRIFNIFLLFLLIFSFLTDTYSRVLRCELAMCFT